MKKMFILAIIAIVMVSGCIDNPSQTQTDIESNDVIAVTSPSVIPATIYNGDSFDVNFQVTNTHDTRDIEDVSVWIENWNPCKLNAINGLPIEEGKSFYLGFEEGTTKLTAGSSLPVGLTLTGTTPDENLPGICKIIYRMNYGLKAVTTFSGITVMESGAYRALLKSGETPSESPSQNIGTGPIKMIFSTEQRFPTESVNGKQITMSMKIENRGSGVFGDIPAESIKLKIPRDLLFLDVNGKLLEEPCTSFNIIVDETKLENGITGNILLEGEETVEDCTDGFDNNGDSLVDCEDTNCATALCGDGCTCADGIKIETNCSDTIDNDEDGEVDCVDSDCDKEVFEDLGYKCFAKGAIELNCTDGLDNDDDGFADCADRNCLFQCIENEVCNEDGDKDEDGLSGCDDPDCDGYLCGQVNGCICKHYEDVPGKKLNTYGFSKTSTLNFEHTGVEYKITLYKESDVAHIILKINHSGVEELQTFEIHKVSKIENSNVFINITEIYEDTITIDTYQEFGEKTETACDDLFDNDMDGAIDELDTDCGFIPVCVPGEDKECTFLEDCSDDIDNDGDGFIDCKDMKSCDTESCGIGCVCLDGEKTEDNCIDGIDNDNDGIIDCDPECKTSLGDIWYENTCGTEEQLDQQASDEDYIVFTNGKKIPMLDDKSILLRCVFNADIEVPYEKSYYIQAEYDYKYEIRDEIEVDIRVE